MISRPIRLHPEAADELRVAVSWYANRSPRAARVFLTELERTLLRVSSFPQQFPAFTPKTRRAVLRRFPFVIVFRHNDEGIDIIAIAHSRRRPGYWRDRGSLP